MAITATQTKNPASVYNHARGRHLDDAGTPALKTITLGFLPRYVRWLDDTSRVMWEWYEGMADGTTLKTAAAGTRTLDTADVGITVNDAALTVTIAAAVIAQNDQYSWEAIG